MIKNILAFIVFILFSLSVFSNNEYKNIDDRSKSVPDSLQTIKQINEFLVKDLKNNKDKIRAYYVWISHNIKYDLAQLDNHRRYNHNAEVIEEVLLKRQGVCHHYSVLFQSFCQQSGIKSYIVSGYVRYTDGTIPPYSHAWNVVEIDSDYYNIDVTWAAGYVTNNKYIHKFRDDYFLISPKDFIKTHMPFDPIWELLDNPINNLDFQKQDYTKLKTKGDFNYRVLIENTEKLDKLSKLESSNNRITKSGITNDLIKKEINENTLQLNYIKYNMAVDTLNMGVANYNLYILHKNRRFLNPNIQDRRIKELFNDAYHQLYKADDMFANLYSSDEKLYKLILDAKNKMPDLLSSIEKENTFLEKYLKTWKPFRVFMFMQ